MYREWIAQAIRSKTSSGQVPNRVRSFQNVFWTNSKPRMITSKRLLNKFQTAYDHFKTFFEQISNRVWSFQNVFWINFKTSSEQLSNRVWSFQNVFWMNFKKHLIVTKNKEWPYDWLIDWKYFDSNSVLNYKKRRGATGRRGKSLAYDKKKVIFSFFYRYYDILTDFWPLWKCKKSQLQSCRIFFPKKGLLNRDSETARPKILNQWFFWVRSTERSIRRSRLVTVMLSFGKNPT